MGDDEEGAGVVHERLLQDVLRLHVEVVRGLIENEEVRGADQHADEGDAGALTTGEDADFFEDVIAAEKEATEDVAGGHGGTAGLNLLDRFEDGEVGVEFVGVVLIEEGGEGFGAHFMLACGGVFLARDHAAEGGFSSAVRPDNRDLFTAGDLEVEVTEDGEVFAIFERINLGGAVELGDEVGGGRRIREAEGDGGFLGVDLDALDFGEELDAGLDEGGLVCGGAEAVDELLGLGDLAVLGDFLFPQGVLSFLELALVGGVVSGEFLGATVVEGDGAGGEAVHHGAVVGDEDDRSFIRVEVVLHEALGADIEVVGGLVEEEDFGLGEEELGHRDSHLPAAGELAAIAGEVGSLEAESGEDGLDAGLHARGVMAVKEELELADSLKHVGEGRGAGVEFFEFGGVAVDLFLNGLGFGEGGFGFIVERDALDVDAFLGEVADAVVLGLVDFSAIGKKGTADALHESGLACAIVTGEGDALLVSDGEGEVFENDTRAKFDAEVFYSKHAGGLGQSRVDENQKARR